jgi:hypothetical protein
MTSLSNPDFSEDTAFLLFRVGPIGSMPEGFGQALASEINGAFVPSSQVNIIDHINFGNLESETARRVASNTMGNILTRQAVQQLSDRKHVILDKYYNSALSRELLNEYHRIGNVSLVALNFEIPKAVLISRLDRRVEAGSFVIPGSPRITTEHFVNRMVVSITKPTLDEGIDKIINLKGNRATDYLVEEVVESLSIS